ncbi:CobW family GTP-binding protein [Salinicola rhizosphaerae]|uniref:Cobalamin biosynthesis protein CobW n=1 Tax=Salinicola rhizosphaerae TaxID=1443141 RepID=A0ABQ3DVR2_9GAMM|nr:CobW family GTP-binding protein [Salinicola rhizosphaerae]GHB17326.1 cobalamin biosynthesis protein CobW [Salinicola rhizosphaerae]
MSGVRRDTRSTEEPTTIAVTLVAGYLGAGKTTWLNDRLREGVAEDTLVLVNDFGTINVDAELIEYQGERLLQLSSGCLCCSLSDELGTQLSRISRWPHPPTALIIETSGVARPERIADMIRVARRYRLERIVTLVDLSTLTRRLDDQRVGDLVASQIVHANELSINREALLTSDAQACAFRRLAELAPTQATVISLSTSTLPAKRARSRPQAQATFIPAAPTPEPDWQRFSVRLSASISRKALESLLAAHQDAIARAKGFIDCDGRRYVFQWSGGRPSWTPTTPGRGGPSQLTGIGFRSERLTRLICALEKLA